MHPHRMGRIAQPAVSERIRCKQVAKLIVEKGRGYMRTQRYDRTPSQSHKPDQSSP
jgi:hypothetical protein